MAACREHDNADPAIILLSAEGIIRFGHLNCKFPRYDSVSVGMSDHTEAHQKPIDKPVAEQDERREESIGGADGERNEETLHRGAHEKPG